MFQSIMVADDRPSMRTELRRLLENEMDLFIAGETGESHYLPEMIQALQPNVLILNLRMLGANPNDGLERLCATSRHTKVILITSDVDDDRAQEALRTGAAAYVLRETCMAEMVRATRTVLSGFRFLGSPFYDRAVETYISTKRCLSPDPSHMLDFEFQHFYT